MSLERHYKGSELAELLSLHPETIRRAAERGELHSVRVGRDRRYPLSAVNAWLEGATSAKVTPLRHRRTA